MNCLRFVPAALRLQKNRLDRQGTCLVQHQGIQKYKPLIYDSRIDTSHAWKCSAMVQLGCLKYSYMRGGIVFLQ